jgi:WD40 repeat protein
VPITVPSEDEKNPAAPASPKKKTRERPGVKETALQAPSKGPGSAKRLILPLLGVTIGAAVGVWYPGRGKDSPASMQTATAEVESQGAVAPRKEAESPPPPLPSPPAAVEPKVTNETRPPAPVETAPAPVEKKSPAPVVKRPPGPAVLKGDCLVAWRTIGTGEIRCFNLTKNAFEPLPNLHVDREDLSAIGFSSDGRLLLCSNSDGESILYDRVTHQRTKLPAAAKSAYNLSTNGKWLVTVTGDQGTMRPPYSLGLFDVPKKAAVPLQGLPVPYSKGAPGKPTISADGNRLAYDVNFNVRVYDRRTQTEIDAGDGTRAHITADGTRVIYTATAGHWTTALYDVEKHAQVPLPGIDFESVNTSVGDISPDGRFIVVGGAGTGGPFTDEMGVALYDVAAGEYLPLTNLTGTRSAEELRVSSDGRYVSGRTFGAPCTVFIYDRQTQQLVKPPGIDLERAQLAVFSPTPCEPWAAVESEPKAPEPPLDPRAMARKLVERAQAARTPGEQRILIAKAITLDDSPDYRRAYDEACGKKKPSSLDLGALDLPVSCLAWSKDGKRVAAGAFAWQDVYKPPRNKLKVWDAVTGNEIFTLPIPGVVADVAFSPDGKRLASASDYGDVSLWDMTSGTRAKKLDISKSAQLVTWSPDGRRLAAVGSNYGMIKVIDSQSGKELFDFRGKPMDLASVAELVFTPDGGKLAAVLTENGFNKTYLRSYDLTAGKVQTNVELPKNIGRVAFLPDAQHVLLVTANNNVDPGKLLFYNVASGKTEKLDYPADAAFNNCALAWSPVKAATGRVLAVSRDTIELWVLHESPYRLEKLRSLELAVPQPGRIAWSPDAKRLLVASQQSVSIQDVEPAESAAIRTAGGRSPDEIFKEAERDTGLTVRDGKLDPEPAGG